MSPMHSQPMSETPTLKQRELCYQKGSPRRRLGIIHKVSVEPRDSLYMLGEGGEYTEGGERFLETLSGEGVLDTTRDMHSFFFF